jgi:hypothetical protein
LTFLCRVAARRSETISRPILDPNLRHALSAFSNAADPDPDPFANGSFDPDDDDAFATGSVDPHDDSDADDDAFSNGSDNDDDNEDEDEDEEADDDDDDDDDDEDEIEDVERTGIDAAGK